MIIGTQLTQMVHLPSKYIGLNFMSVNENLVIVMKQELRKELTTWMNQLAFPARQQEHYRGPCVTLDNKRKGTLKVILDNLDHIST